MTTLVHKTLGHLDTSAAVKVRPDRKKRLRLQCKQTIIEQQIDYDSWLINGRKESFRWAEGLLLMGGRIASDGRKDCLYPIWLF